MQLEKLSQSGWIGLTRVCQLLEVSSRESALRILEGYGLKHRQLASTGSYKGRVQFRECEVRDVANKFNNK